jgi:pimeloyl-ACP methyl ester carboxylesterase
MPEPTTRRVKGADGLVLQLYEWSAEGTPLLLLHGFGNDSHVWYDFAPEVAPYYRTLALDQRGHGDSDRDPERRYDHVSMARDVEAVCEGLGLERLVLVGHSMGGRVAMRFAGRNPQKVAGLVLVDTGPELDPRGTSRIREEAESGPATLESVAQFDDVLARNYPAVSPRVRGRLAQAWLRARPDGRFEPKTDPAFRMGREEIDADALRAAAREETDALWAALRALPCPALVVRGAASDVLSPETADAMVDDALPDGRLAVVSRAGHSVMLDHPEGFRDAVCAFVLGDD